MAFSKVAKGKIVRRFGENIFGNPKYDSLLQRKNIPPGQVKTRKKQKSDFGRGLNEKQKLKFIYGMREKQFRSVFKKASALEGSTGDNFCILLERRLDNIIYQLGWAWSRSQARQIVSHKHITVNDKVTNVPSFSVRQDDVIGVKNKKGSLEMIEVNITQNEHRIVPAWLESDKEKKQGIVKRLPLRSEIQNHTNELLIIEYYSR